MLQKINRLILKDLRNNEYTIIVNQIVKMEPGIKKEEEKN